MLTCYMVDRRALLAEGRTVGLVHYDDICPLELQAHVDTLFPDGVSVHGEQYLLRNASDPKLASPNIEMLFEYVRRACFPSRPSRFQSYFGCETIDQARYFRERHGDPLNGIWLVEAERSFTADMHFLQRGSSVLVGSYFAQQYWQGVASEDPFWEVLLVPPVGVLSRVA